MTIEIRGSEFILLTEKALYKPNEQLLVIADVHLGKASHFRKEGISISAAAQLEDYTNLASLLHRVAPQKVYFLGDLFHSTFNRDWHYFSDLIGQFPAIKFTLVRGNHDLIDDDLFHELGIDVKDLIEDDNFRYVHEPEQKDDNSRFVISGHVHPGVVISGKARQSLKIPCFYCTDSQMILPAFGTLTGLYSMERASDSITYAVLPGEVRRIN